MEKCLEGLFDISSLRHFAFSRVQNNDRIPVFNGKFCTKLNNLYFSSFPCVVANYTYCILCPEKETTETLKTVYVFKLILFFNKTKITNLLKQNSLIVE